MIVDTPGEVPGGDVDNMVLPTDLAAEPADVGVEYLQVAAVALSPPNPFDDGRDQFAETAQDAAVLVHELRRRLDDGDFDLFTSAKNFCCHDKLPFPIVVASKAAIEWRIGGPHLREQRYTLGRSPICT